MNITKYEEEFQARQFEALQKTGQNLHPKSWYLANQKSIPYFREKLDMDKISNKVFVSNVVLRILDSINAE